MMGVERFRKDFGAIGHSSEQFYPAKYLCIHFQLIYNIAFRVWISKLPNHGFHVITPCELEHWPWIPLMCISSIDWRPNFEFTGVVINWKPMVYKFHSFKIEINHCSKKKLKWQWFDPKNSYKQLQQQQQSQRERLQDKSVDEAEFLFLNLSWSTRQKNALQNSKVSWPGAKQKSI